MTCVALFGGNITLCELNCNCVSETGTWRRISANDRGGPFYLHSKNQSVECRYPGLWQNYFKLVWGHCVFFYHDLSPLSVCDIFWDIYFFVFVLRRLWWTILCRWSPISLTLEVLWCWWCGGSQQIIKLQIQLFALRPCLRNAGWFAMCSPLAMWVFPFHMLGLYLQVTLYPNFLHLDAQSSVKNIIELCHCLYLFGLGTDYSSGHWPSIWCGISAVFASKWN